MSKTIKAHDRVFEIFESHDGQMRVKSPGLHDGSIEVNIKKERYHISVRGIDTVLFSNHIKEAVTLVCEQMIRTPLNVETDRLFLDMDKYYEDLE